MLIKALSRNFQFFINMISTQQQILESTEIQADLGKSPKKMINENALYDTIPEYRSKISIFTTRVSLYSLIRQYQGNDAFPLPCRGGKDFFSIDAKDGNTYPCGYRGDENLGKSKGYY